MIDNYTNANRYFFYLRYSKEFGSSYLTGLTEIERKSLEKYLSEALNLITCKGQQMAL